MTKKKNTSNKTGKTGKNKSALPRKMKSMLATPSAKLVLFERDKQKVIIPPKLNKEINILIASSPLDFYTSPHLMDLSAHKHIERVKPIEDVKVGYDDLPGGKILQKMHVFNFIMLENSEILRAIKKIYKISTSVFRMSLQKARLSSNFKAFPDGGTDNSGNKAWDRLRQISFINFIVFLCSQVGKVFIFTSWLIKYSLWGFKALFAKDEIISFNAKAFTSPTLAVNYNQRNLNQHIYIRPDYNQGKLDVNYGDDYYFNPDQIKAYNLKEKTSKSSRNYGESAIMVFRYVGVWRPALAFVVMALIVIIPFKISAYLKRVDTIRGQVLGQAEQALSDIDMAKIALTSFNFTGAEQGLASANEKFVSAQKQLDQIKSLLTILADASPVGNAYKSGKNILELGDHLSGAGSHLLNGLNGLMAKDDNPLTSKIKGFKAESVLALNELEIAQNNFKNIDSSDIPTGKRDQFNQVGKWLPVFINGLQELNSSLDFGINFLGDNSLKRYLVVFQNDNELRATGGFMGSYALVDFKSGKIDKITIPEDGSYTARAKLTELWQSPKALQGLDPRWEFQDSNWWPDYLTSAQNIMEFYNKSGGPTVDGVIAINSGWMKELIGALGPVDLPDYGKTITAENYEAELQKSIEIESADKSKAKKILGDLSSELLKRLFDSAPDKYLALAGVVKSGLSQKEIMIYMRDSELQKFVYDHSWDGRIKDASFDYLNVVSTNIGGGKTDDVVNQKIYHKVSIGSDGSVIDTVLINRYHFGPTDELFTKATNTDYLRIYVPKGSELISAAGFDKAINPKPRLVEDYLKPNPKLEAENNATLDDASGVSIYNESDKTVFASWLIVSVGQSREAVLTYKLPYKLDLKKMDGGNKSDFYRVLVQKQSGQRNIEFFNQIEYPQEIKPADISSGMSLNNNGLISSGKLEGDSLYYVNFKKSK